MNRKRVLAVLLSGVMVTGLLTACGGNSSGGGTNESAAPAADNSEAAADSGDRALLLRIPVRVTGK